MGSSTGHPWTMRANSLPHRLRLRQRQAACLARQLCTTSAPSLLPRTKRASWSSHRSSHPVGFPMPWAMAPPKRQAVQEWMWRMARSCRPKPRATGPMMMQGHPPSHQAAQLLLPCCWSFQAGCSSCSSAASPLCTARARAAPCWVRLLGSGACQLEWQACPHSPTVQAGPSDIRSHGCAAMVPCSSRQPAPPLWPS